MDFEDYFFLFIFGIAMLIIPIVNLTRINRLEDELRRLRGLIGQAGTTAAPSTTVAAPTKAKPAMAAQAVTAPATAAAQTSSPPAWASKPASGEAKAATAPKVKKEGPSLAFRFSAQFPVWIGGIALALAGFYLVKYSIENNLISDQMRVILGALFGIALIFAARKIRERGSVANGTRIAQALSGAGIAVLYLAIFAASELYHLIPGLVGFAGMAAITALAVVLSVRHGAPIALLGLLGGFLTPAVISSESQNVATLFIYLYAVYTGLMIVSLKQRWWWLTIPTIIGAFLWVIVWLIAGDASPTDSLWIGLFLLGISATMVSISYRQLEAEGSGRLLPRFTTAAALNYLGLSGALLLMGITASQAGFEPMNWGLFGLLSAGCIALAIFRPALYAVTPLGALAVVSVMLIGWSTPDTNYYFSVLLAFAGLFMASGYWMLWRSEKPVIWALQTVASALGFFLIAYLGFSDKVTPFGIGYSWGAIALLLGALASYSVDMIRNHTAFNEQTRNHLLAIFLIGGTSFISLALAIEVRGEFLSLAFAGEILAVCWIQSHLRLPYLRAITAVLMGVFAYVLLPQILLILEVSAYSLVEAQLHLQESVPIVDWPWLQLGVPAACMVMGSWLLRRETDSRLVRVMELSAIALLGTMGYYMMRHAFHMDENILFVKAGFIERGVISNAIFAMALACFYVGNRFARPAVIWGGMALLGTACFRIVFFDLLGYNPLFSDSQKVGEMFLFNGLFVTYFLPIIWLHLASQQLRIAGQPQMVTPMRGAMFVMMFIFLSYSIRQIFQGSDLSGSGASNAETYSYSAIWLLYGFALAFIGAWKKQPLLHHASLAMLILVVGKVFLYDAAELEGLYRIFSFFGLGICLLAISYFYTRFVYRKLD